MKQLKSLPFEMSITGIGTFDIFDPKLFSLHTNVGRLCNDGNDFRFVLSSISEIGRLKTTCSRNELR
jgi:hypothetical protein